MKRVAPSAHMSAAILPLLPINTSGAGGEGGERKRGYEKEGGKEVTMCVVILAPRYPGVLLHMLAVSRLPRKHPNPPSESLTCLPSGASSRRFSGCGRGDSTVHSHIRKDNSLMHRMPYLQVLVDKVITMQVLRKKQETVF